MSHKIQINAINVFHKSVKNFLKHVSQIISNRFLHYVPQMYPNYFKISNEQHIIFHKFATQLLLVTQFLNQKLWHHVPHKFLKYVPQINSNYFHRIPWIQNCSRRFNQVPQTHLIFFFQIFHKCSCHHI